MTERKPQDQDRYIVRFPDNMREQLKDLAAANGRSLNAEIIHRLQQTLDAETVPVAPDLPVELRAQPVELRPEQISQLAEELKFHFEAMFTGKSNPPDEPRDDLPPPKSRGGGGGSSVLDKALPGRLQRDKLHHRGK